VSVEAISWALNLAPVPAGRGGQPSSACKFVLVGLANHAGPDGTGAFPSVATLIRYTGLSERTVRTCLHRLEAGGLSGAAIRTLSRSGSSAPTVRRLAREAVAGRVAAAAAVDRRGQPLRAGVGHRGITPYCFIAAQATAAAAAAPFTEKWLRSSEMYSFLSTWRPNAPRS
jgi:helix-turn-helix protein